MKVQNKSGMELKLLKQENIAASSADAENINGNTMHSHQNTVSRIGEIRFMH